ncbi:hypothetical protein PtB15_6B887 [Puccinia triticina]|nr:hypothetical protein PtB15_6B887 [Puccinia triticina]
MRPSACESGSQLYFGPAQAPRGEGSQLVELWASGLRWESTLRWFQPFPVLSLSLSPFFSTTSTIRARLLTITYLETTRGILQHPSDGNHENSSNETSNSDKPSAANTAPTKPKKKLNRQLASCSGCRSVTNGEQDATEPCSECYKRNLTCDYSGASAPPS